MRELADGLRALCDDVSDHNLVLAVNLFGIKKACILGQYTQSYWQGVANLAGINDGHKYELWRGINLAPFVNVLDGSLDGGRADQSEKSDYKSQAELAGELRQVCANCPEGRLITVLMLFAIKHAHALNRISRERVRAILAASGNKRSHAGDMKKGAKLADYVSFNRYPTNEDVWCSSVLSVIEAMLEAGLSLLSIARELNSMGFQSVRGGKFNGQYVKHLAVKHAILPDNARFPRRPVPAATQRAEELRSILMPMLDAGLSFREMSHRLNHLGLKPVRAHQYNPTQVKNIIQRLQRRHASFAPTGAQKQL